MEETLCLRGICGHAPGPIPEPQRYARTLKEYGVHRKETSRRQGERSEVAHKWEMMGNVMKFVFQGD